MLIELPDSLYSLAPVLATGLGVGVMYVMFEGWAYLQRRRRRRSPLTRGLLRGPGESLRIVLHDLYTDMAGYFQLVIAGPVLVLSIHLSQSYLGGKPETAFRIIFSVIFAVGVCIYGMRKILRLAAKVRQVQLGLECELAVGQELNRLEGHGFRVFHDLPAEDFNIDHVVVGPTGVFAVETKGRSKPMRGKGGDDARVVFDGKNLRFPTWSESQPIEQARRQAQWLHQWLHQWLTRAMGENVAVVPSLVLPGWYVDRISPSDMPVFNGTNPEKVFPKFGKPRYDHAMVQRIAHQLDQRCRDVVPKSDRHTNPAVKRLPA